MKSSLLAAALACLSFAALADEADVKKAVEAKLGKVEKIVKAPMAGIWEVTVDGQIFYADDKGGYLIFGNLLDMKTGKNLTAERQFNALPLELAVKQVRGFGQERHGDVRGSELRLLQEAGKGRPDAEGRHRVHLPAAGARRRFLRKNPRPSGARRTSPGPG
jgi:hypothetical protein